ncbi:leucine rich repeat protein, putative [Eimeria brunetti]|uniref:Leucine rich repeat protein, putative n=1 Tax=Eimeria brunetti TaxID=51314 RepID=U6M0C2_9EIME|nr:leucine rich repeat protein, putative [Eimeria brunetti]
MSASRTRLFPNKKVPSAAALLRSAGGVAVGPILNAAKLKALLLADGNSARKWKNLDLSNSSIRKIELSLGEVAALDFECLTHLDLNGNLLVSLDGHSLPFPHLQALCASNCRINSITNFGSHFRLRQLDISGNHLTNIINLSNTPLRFTLLELNLARNQISEFKGLAPLSTFESLEILDLRQNPLCNFGNVAEGFALICCTTICKLNGHTVSPQVRKAVEAWARDEACGVATVATVEAFREALQHPDGPSLLCSTSPSPTMGRFNRMQSVRAGPDLPYTTPAEASVKSDADTCDAEYRRGHARRAEVCRSSRSCSCVHSMINERIRSTMTRAVSTAVQTTPDISQEVPIGGDISSSEVQAAAASCATEKGKEALEESPAWTSGDCRKGSTECHRGDSPETREEAPVVVGHQVGMVQTESQLEGAAGERCKFFLLQKVLRSEYYHSISARDGRIRAASASERCVSNRDGLRCCAGTQTPGGRISPSEFPISSSSSDGIAKRDGAEDEESYQESNLLTEPVDGIPAGSPGSTERRDSPNAAVENVISEQEEYESA